MTAALRRTQAAIRRNEAACARRDTRTWVMQRRARTRRLIELGGLVAKSGLEEAVAAREADTQAAILGALLALVDNLQAFPTDADARAHIAHWHERGRRALRDTDTPTPTDTIEPA